MARGLWEFDTFCNIPHYVGQFLSRLIFYPIQTEPLGLFSKLCNTLRACSKKAYHCHSFICRKSTDVINLWDKFLYRQLQENTLQMHIVSVKFWQNLAKSILFDFQQIRLHVFCLPQVNISDCNILLYTPCQNTGMWNFSNVPILKKL